MPSLCDECGKNRPTSPNERQEGKRVCAQCENDMLERECILVLTLLIFAADEDSRETIISTYIDEYERGAREVLRQKWGQVFPFDAHLDELSETIHGFIGRDVYCYGIKDIRIAKPASGYAIRSVEDIRARAVPCELELLEESWRVCPEYWDDSWERGDDSWGEDSDGVKDDKSVHSDWRGDDWRGDDWRGDDWRGDDWRGDDSWDEDDFVAAGHS